MQLCEKKFYWLQLTQILAVTTIRTTKTILTTREQKDIKIIWLWPRRNLPSLLLKSPLHLGWAYSPSEPLTDVPGHTMKKASDFEPITYFGLGQDISDATNTML